MAKANETVVEDKIDWVVVLEDGSESPFVFEDYCNEVGEFSDMPLEYSEFEECFIFVTKEEAMTHPLWQGAPVQAWPDDVPL